MNNKNKIIYIRPKEALILYEELGFGKANLATIRLLIKKENLGKKIGGKWFINKEKFTKFLKEE